MKVTKAKIKKHARKIKNVTEEEFKELQEGYKKLIGNVQSLNSPALLAISLVGIFIILYFRNNFLDIIGLLVFVYPFYLFVQKESHEEGFFEGYYEKMKGGHGSSGNSGGDGKEDDKKDN